MARLYTDYTLSSRKQLFYYTQKCMGDPEPKKWGFSGTQWVREPIFWVTMGSFCKILLITAVGTLIQYESFFYRKADALFQGYSTKSF
eukprot:COSAG01_NODE_4394_length_5070_cov_17.651177_6_plen_88_part_00